MSELLYPTPVQIPTILIFYKLYYIHNSAKNKSDKVFRFNYMKCMYFLSFHFILFCLILLYNRERQTDEETCWDFTLFIHWYALYCIGFYNIFLRSLSVKLQIPEWFSIFTSSKFLASMVFVERLYSQINLLQYYYAIRKLMNSTFHCKRH